MFTLGQRPRGSPSTVSTLSTTATEAINRELQRVATWAPAAPTSTDHSTAHPGAGASKQIVAVATKPNFSTSSSIAQKAREPRDRPKAQGYDQDFDSCTAVAVPHVAV